MKLAQWLLYIGLAYVVYMFIPSKSRVLYLAVVGIGGLMYAERTGALARLKGSLAGLG